MARRELPPDHPIRRRVEQGSAAAHAAMPSIRLPLSQHTEQQKKVRAMDDPIEEALAAFENSSDYDVGLLVAEARREHKRLREALARIADPDLLGRTYSEEDVVCLYQEWARNALGADA